MRYLLDTHAAVWLAGNVGKVPPAVVEVLRDEGTALFFSAASVWEIATKARLGKLHEADKILSDLPAFRRRFVLSELPVRDEHALMAGRLPGPRRDPFDRMLIAQSRVEGLVVVTADPVFAEYGVEVFW
jgi:PIN domain nuclease of toxin-antitoxin system